MSRLSLSRHLVVVLPVILVMLMLAGCALPDLQPSRKAEPARPPALVKGTTVALVVPRGQAPAVVNALVSGAQHGVEAQTGSANPARVYVYYGEGDWLHQLNALPGRTVIGVLGVPLYRQMRDAGLMDKRVVFAFLSELPDGDEGVTAWRFFSSRADEAEAMSRLVVDELGIRSVASFGQEDQYSMQLTGELEQKLASRGVILQRITATGQPGAWGDTLASWVNPTINESNGTLMPHTPFEAVFVTTSWRNLQALNTAFASNGEERLLMAGTMLWDSFNARGNQNASKYALVTWPSQYLPDQAPEVLAGTKANTSWGALGYDFVRFAARLGLEGRPSSDEITRACRRAASMSFTMAPISYDADGKASQKLYMVQAGLNGPQLASTSALLNAMQEARTHMEQRAASSNPSGATTGADGAIMHTGPRSSYKLSLPGLRR